MGLFDYFTNDAQKQAAADQTAGINAGMGQYGNYVGQGRNALQDYYGLASGSVTGGVNAGSSALGQNYGAGVNALSQNFGAGQGALSSNYGAGVNALSSNYGAGQNALGSNYGAGIDALSQNYGAGVNALTGAYGAGIMPNQWNFQQGQQGTQQYGNALGLNGPAGNAAATAGFWNNPAIQSQLDIGSENVLRNQARTGQLASGKTNVDLQNLGQQVASQGWNNYVSQLSPYLNMSQGAAANIGNLYSGYGNQVAGQYANLGNQTSGAYQNLGNQSANLSAGLGGQLAGQYANLGNQSAGLYQGLGSQLAGQYGQLGQGLNQNQMQGGQLNAGIWQGLGTGLANSFNNQGQAAYGAQTSIGNANANADLASATASGNIWNTVLGGVSALAGAPSSFYKTAGNVGSAIGNTFTGGNPSGTGYAPSSGLNWSDIRIKYGIEKLAELADGSNVYRFKYKGDPARRTHIGLMAQEVEKTNPAAVYDIGGIKAVDYGAATDRAAAIMKLAA